MNVGNEAAPTESAPASTTAVLSTRPGAALEGARESLRTKWAALAPTARATTLVLGALIVFGVVIRVQRLGVPPHFTFDEELFVRPAHGYLLGRTDANDHPPLGKLFMAVGILLFGANPVGWRFASLVFGLQTLVIAQWTGAALFRSSRAGWFACAAIAADGFFIGYSRCGLLDGMLTCLVLWSFLAAVTARTALDVVSSALLVGLAASVKWSGAFALFPAAAAVLLLGQVDRRTVLLFAVTPLVHVALWGAGLWLTGDRNDPRTIVELMVRLFHHHQQMGLKDNALASPWYSWSILWHPIVVKLSPHGIGSTYASTVSNVALWLGATVCLLCTPFVPLASWILKWWKKTDLVPSSVLRPLLLADFGWLALLSPWMLGRGKYTFHYHYLPSWAFAVLLATGALAWLEEKHERIVLGISVLTLGVALYFAPVWGEFTLSEHAANLRLLFKNWKP